MHQFAVGNMNNKLGTLKALINFPLSFSYQYEVGIMISMGPEMDKKNENLFHEDLRYYIRLMRYESFWFGNLDYLDNSHGGRFIKIYLECRWIVNMVLLFSTSTVLYFTEDFGLFNGTFIYGPLILMAAALVTIASHQGPEQKILTDSLNQHFLTNCEPWMINLRQKFLKPIKKSVEFYTWYNVVVCFFYVIVPIVLEAILHFGFNSIKSHHLLLPLPFTPLYGKSPGWGWKFYSITLANTFACFELVQTLISFISSYGLLTSYFVAELKIFKERVKSIDLFASSIELDRQIKEIVTWHNRVIV